MKDRFQRYQERQKERGLVVVKVFVPKGHIDKLKAFAKKLRGKK